MRKEFIKSPKTGANSAGKNISLWQLLVMALIVSVYTVSAQPLTARPDRGMGGKGGHQTTGIDSISLQNGGVHLQIPLASLPPVAGGKLSYTLTAYYNSKLWDVQQGETRRGQTQQPGCQPPYSTETVKVSDAGGWKIGGQYQIFFRDARDDYEYFLPDTETCYGYEFYFMQGAFFKPMLRMPDGSEHELRISTPFEIYNSQGTREHLKWFYKQSGGMRNHPTFTSPVRMHTTDGSYISVVVNPESYPVSSTIYLKDGTKIENSADGQRIKDTNGNSILLTYGSAKDEQTQREIKWSQTTYNGQNATKVEYQKVGGAWETVWVVWGETTVRGKLYYKTDWNPQGGGPSFNPNICYSHEELPLNTFGVVREIILPETEPGVAPQKYSFAYNSDVSSGQVTTQDARFSCLNGDNPAPYTRTASRGLGELSQVTTPTGAQIKYEYVWDGIHDFVSGPLIQGNNQNPNNIARDVVKKKYLIHDGTTDIWTYDISTDSNYVIEGKVTNPDNSTRTEFYYRTNISYGGYGGTDGLGGLTYRTNDSNKVITEKKWIHLGGVTPAFGSVTQFQGINTVVDTEFMTLLDDNGNRVKTSATKFQYDYNGELIQTVEYDWYAPPSDPFVVPAGATILRTVNNSFYNQAVNVSDPNAYQNRTVGDSTVILGALRETSVGASQTRFSFDGQSWGMPPTKGNVTQVSAWNDTNSQWISASSTYNSHGNLTATTDAKGNTAQIFYEDATYAMPTKTIVDPQNGTGQQIATTIYDFYTGLPTSSTDANGNVSSIDYTNLLTGAVDPFGRPGTVYSPYAVVEGGNKRQTVRTYYEDGARMMRVESDLFNEGDQLVKARESRDQLGRTVLTERNENGASGYSIFAQTVYDTQQRIVMASNPRRAAAASTDGWTRVTSDILGRTTEAATFSGAALPPMTGTNTSWTGSVLTSYNANQTTVTDQAGKKRRSVTNALGRLVRVDEPNMLGQLDDNGVPAQPTSYEYDPLGNLRKVTQEAQVREFFYDSLSRLKEARNPESGIIQYQYDANGNLTQKKDARNVITTYAYDALNRVTQRSYAGGGAAATLPVTYTYDNLQYAKGRLTKVDNGFSTTEYQEFDALGRVRQSRQTTGGAVYPPMTYTYNLAGALVEQTYPSGRKVRNTFEADGDLAKVETQKAGASWQTRAEEFAYTAAGAVSSLKLGNGRFESTQFNSRLQPTQIALGATPNATNLLKINYAYNIAGQNNANNGNVISQTITVPTVGASPGFTAVQTYSYDALNRLTDAKEMVGTSQKWRQVFTYDRYGNRNFSEASTTTLPKRCLGGGFGGTGDPVVCAADRKIYNPSISQSNNRIVQDQDGDAQPDYLYDPAGNTTRDATGKTFVYDGENKQVSVSSGTSGVIGEYWYDGDGKRVKKRGSINGQIEETVFVYDAFGKLVAEYSNQTAQTQQISYLTTDHLGSPRINTDQDGQVITRHDYHPFGEEIFSTPQRNNGIGYRSDSIRQQFTGYERDLETDLDFAQARMYANRLGRFTTVDPLMASADIINPQTFNRYVYVGNNPVNITDPTGEIWGVSGNSIEWFDDEAAMKAAGFTAYTALVGMVGNQLVALNPNANQVMSAASAGAAIQQIVAWGASEALIAGSLSALGVGAMSAAAIAATIACGTPCTNLHQANSGYAGSSARDYANMGRWLYGDAAPKTIFDYVDSQGNILPQYMMNENKSQDAAEQSTNTEANKPDTSANQGGGKDARKSNPDRVESAKEKEAKLRAELADLQSRQDRYPGIQKDIAKLKSQIKQAVEKQKKSESHGRKGKRK